MSTSPFSFLKQITEALSAGERPYQCPYCKATFASAHSRSGKARTYMLQARNDKLSNHIDRHHDGRPKLTFRGPKS